MSGTLGVAGSVVTDLREVIAIDASGVGRLLGLRQSLARRGARLVIATASPRVRHVLQLTALDAIFGIASSNSRSAHPTDAASSPARLCRCA